MSRQPDLSSEPSEQPALPGLAALRQPVQPANELWPGIAARLTPAPSAPVQAPAATQPSTTSARRRQPRRWPVALAASLSVAVLAGLMLPQLLARWLPQSLQGRVQGALGELSATDLQRTTLLAALPAFGSAEPAEARVPVEDDAARLAALPGQPQRYRTLRSETDDARAPAGLMRAAFQRVPPQKAAASRWSAASGSEGQKALLRANLRLMQVTEQEIRRALRQEPDSESLQAMLTQIDAQQAAVQRLLRADRR